MGFTDSRIPGYQVKKRKEEDTETISTLPFCYYKPVFPKMLIVSKRDPWGFCFVFPAIEKLLQCFFVEERDTENLTLFVQNVYVNYIPTKQ